MDLNDLANENLMLLFIKQAFRQSDLVFWFKMVCPEQFLFISPAYEKLFQISCDHILQNPAAWYQRIDVQHREIIKTHYEQAISTVSTAKKHRYRLLLPDGKTCWIEEEYFVYPDAAKQPVYLMGIIRDITESILQEEELYTASAYFMKFSELCEDVFWVRSFDYSRQLYVSPSFTKVWGRDCNLLYANPASWNDFLHPDDQQRINNKIPVERSVYADPQAKYYEDYRIIKPSGEVRYIVDCSFPIFSKNHDLLGFAGIARDITEQVLYQKALTEAKEKAEIADKVKSEFMANISHDLKTPLNGILGCAQLLKLTPHLPAQNELLDNLHTASKTLSQLIDDVLEYTRLEHGDLPLRYSAFNLYQATLEITHILQAKAAEKQINLILEGIDTKQVVLLDFHRYKRILLNLVSNAIKFSAEKQPIVIKLTIIDSADKGHAEAVVQVTDYGIGIPEDKLDAIFERFNRVTPAFTNLYEGNGLGLAIVKQFVSEMKGEVSVASRLGQGSTFSCKLPITLAADKT